MSNRPKSDLTLGFLPFSQVLSLVFLDIAQDCSLGQCLTSSRAEKKFVAQIRNRSEVLQHFLLTLLKEDRSNQTDISY